MNRRPDAATVKAKRAEIRRRYARGKPKFSLAARRIAEIEALFSARYHGRLPDDADGPRVRRDHGASPGRRARGSAPINPAMARAMGAVAIDRGRQGAHGRGDPAAATLEGRQARLAPQADRCRPRPTGHHHDRINRCQPRRTTARREARKYERLIVRRRLNGRQATRRIRSAIPQPHKALDHARHVPRRMVSRRQADLRQVCLPQHILLWW
jgi:hypothetical protein